MALLLVLAAVAFAAPARAAVLVSNLGQANGGSGTVGGFDKAQAFTTGANSGGYTLTSVDLKLGAVTGSTNVYTVSIWSSNSSGRPNSSLGTLTKPGSLTSGNNTFTASGSGIDLSASTPYLVVVDGTSGDLLVRNVNSAASANAEDATSATGWSIGDDSLFRTASSTGSWSTFSESMYIRVNGAAKTGTDTTAPAFASAAANGASLVITFDEDLAAAASLANSAFTVKKTASGGSEATVALSTSVAPVISGTTVTLTLGTALVSTDGSVKVTYTKPTTGSANKLVDAASNETATFTDQTVTNNTPAASCTAPSFGTRRNIWTGSLTVGSATGIVGFRGMTGALDDKTFSIGSSNHEIDELVLDIRGAPSLALILSLKDADLTSAEQAALRLHVCNTTTVDLSAATVGSTHHNYNVLYSGAAWTSGSTLAVYLSLPANNAATGAPTISGTAAVGETLMAAKGTIADVDGVPTTFTYQWLRVDGANETDITGATESSYTVTADDIGKTLKVKLGFTDNFDGVEARTSAATATVAQPPTVSIAAVYPKATMRIANPEFRVTISAAQTSAVTVNLSIAQAAGYLSSTTQSIEIPANETSATKKFSGFYTGTTSGDLTATVVAGTGYVPAPTPANAATVAVVAPGYTGILSYFWAEAAYSVTEGDAVEVMVTLRTAANVPKPRESFLTYGIITQVLTGEGDMATQGALNTGAGGDYTHTSERPGTIAPDAWSADGAMFTVTTTHTIATTGDSAYEGDERFKIVLTNAPGGAGSKGSPGETIVTIVEDEALKVTGVAVSSMPSSGEHLRRGRDPLVHGDFQRSGDGDGHAAIAVLAGRGDEAGGLCLGLGLGGTGVLLHRGGGRQRHRRDFLGRGCAFAQRRHDQVHDEYRGEPGGRGADPRRENSGVGPQGGHAPGAVHAHGEHDRAGAHLQRGARHGLGTGVKRVHGEGGRHGGEPGHERPGGGFGQHGDADPGRGGGGVGYGDGELRGAGDQPAAGRRRQGCAGVHRSGGDQRHGQHRAGVCERHGGAQLHRDGGRCNRGCRARRGRGGDGDGR